MTLKRSLLCSIYFFIILSSSWALNISDLLKPTLLPDWQYKDETSSWQKVQLPVKIRGQINEDFYSYELQNTVFLSENLRDQEIYLLTGKLSNGYSSYYLNGVLIYQNGLAPPHYQFQGGIEKGIRLPGELIHFNGENTIEIRCISDNPALTFYPPSIGNYRDSVISARNRSFFNVSIYSYLAFISLFIGLFFLMQFLMKREIHYNMLFALANICISLYFYRIANIPYSLPFTRFYAISKGFLSPAVAFYALFFIDFFHFKVRKIIPVLIISISSIAALSVAFLPATYHATESFFTLTLLPILIWILMMLYYSLKAIKMKKPYARILFLGVLLAVGFGTHDIVCMLRGITPYAWVQGLGIFGLTISMFVSLAISSVKALITIEISEKEIREKNENLEEYVNHIRDAYTALSAVQTSLGDSIETADRTIQSLSQQNDGLNSVMQSQSEDIRQILEAFNQIISSFSEIFSSLDNQNRELDDTFSVMEQMLTNIQELTDGFKESVEFSRSLNETTSSGEQSMNVSQDSILKIRDGSKVINELTETIREISNNLNLLAMNAAIEAAHAGVSGKGFSVVADEMKSLSEQSNDQIDEVSETIGRINERISDGAEKNSEVQGILGDISLKAEGSVRQLDQLYQNLLEQKLATETIQRSMTELKKAARQIFENAESQNTNGQGIRKSIEETTQTLKESRSLFNQIGGETMNMIKVFDQVRSAFNDGKEINRNLEELLKKDI